MADENQMDQGAAVPPQAERRGKAWRERMLRKAAEDLRSAAGAIADEYRARGKEVWDDALHRVRSFQDDSKEYVRAEPNEGGLYRTWGWFRAWVNFPSLG